MKKTVQDVLKDIENNLVGIELNSISGKASVFSISEVNYDNKNIVLNVPNVSKKRATWTFEIVEKIWNDLYYKPATSVEEVLGGSGSSRSQIETIFASLPYVKYLTINGRKHIAYVVKEVHPYGELMRMETAEEEQYAEWMKAVHPVNPYLNLEEKSVSSAIAEIMTEQIKEDYTLEELGKILKSMNENSGNGMQVCSIHVFGIKYGKTILKNDYKVSAIVSAAGLKESYYAELQKGINIYKALMNNTFGIAFVKNDKKLDNLNDTDGTGENILFYGVPGSGKSYFIKKNYPCTIECMERVVFHPEYTYSDFVGQIMPRLDENGNLKYVFSPGPFTKALKAAHDFPEKKHYLIIEEINRGNAPAIFGEIFQLLDRDETGESEYGITNFDIALEVYGDANQKIKIPSNLWLLATMNTSDQNVFTLDTAFQRRWIMRHIENKIDEAVHADDVIEGSTITWGNFAKVVNEQVIESNKMLGSSADKRLGAYFVKPRELKLDRFPEKVLKYLWDDAFKMGHEYIFSDEMTSLDFLIETYEQADGDKIAAVFTESVFNRMKAYRKSVSAFSDNMEELSGDLQESE